MNNKKLYFFDENNAQRYYNWKKIIEERFNYAALTDVFKEIHEISYFRRLK
jgi:hypothetical protein